MVVDVQRTQHTISSSQFDVNFQFPVASTILNVSVINNNALAGAVFSCLKYMNASSFIMKSEDGFSTGESATGILDTFTTTEEYKFPRNVGNPRVLITSINETGTDLVIDYVVTYEYHPPGESAPSARLE